ncbi:MAG: metallophosphoesterase family protein [Bacteroidota bacterium]
MDPFPVDEAPTVDPHAPRLIAIGDVHGCLRTLDALLDRLAPASDVPLVFVGDYIDRGPNSRGVIERLLELEREHPCVFLRGNHDQMMIDFVNDGDLELWRINGGLSTLANYMERDRLRIPDAHVDFIQRTPLYFEADDFVFVHAGLRPDLSIADNLRFGTAETFLWERSHLNADLSGWEKTVVCGHTPVTEPIDQPKLIDIDTGCVYHHRPGYGTLTAVVLPERRFVQVPFQE